MDPTLTVNKRTAETCRPHITYAYRVTVKSSAAEGDFMSYTATVEEVLKNTDRQLEAVSSGSDVELVKKVTCSSVDLQDNKQYLVMGASGSEVTLSRGFRYRLPVDSEALVDLWPKVCSSPECTDYISHLEDFALDLQLSGCPNSSPSALTSGQFMMKSSERKRSDEPEQEAFSRGNSDALWRRSAQRRWEIPR
ncbi:hypothetical protein NQZ68_027118 [Dissostichus eleginoides]|nr:hypothetical protein NQZ68_027118 [Dissostichus eleginoides]